MPTLFSRIIRGEIPSYKVAEDENCYAFLDIRPIVYGHTLVIPKVEIDYYFDLGDDYLAGLNAFAKKVAAVLKEEVPCLRIGVMIAGLEVPHAHIHLVPMNSISELSFTNPRPKVTEEEMKDLSLRLSSAFEKKWR